MKVFRNGVLAFVFLFLTINCAFPQIATEINDDLYEDMVQWEISGKIQKLPMIRPYPLSLIKDVLLKVMECDDAFAAEKASYYYRQLFGDGTLRVGAASNGIMVLGDYSGNNKQLDVNPFLCINAEVLDKCTVSFGVTPIFTNVRRREEVIPVGRTSNYDYETDRMNSNNVFISSSSLVAYGTPDVYMQAGMTRSNFGNFYSDGVMLNANANQAGHISFTINKEKLSYSLGMLMLTATDVRGVHTNPQKYLYFHSLRYSPIPSLDFTLYETAVTGPRFDLTYLLPAALYMPIQQLIGYDSENLMMGIQMAYTITNSLRLTGDICVDDVNFNELLKFNFDTKMKFAAQLGFQYAPSGDNMLKMFALDYTLVMPYMYTHSQKNNGTISYGTNYQNHTTNGRSLGSQIPPNSDKVNLEFKLSLIGRLKFNMTATLIRHCNVNEGLPFNVVQQYLMENENGVDTSGGIFDYPDAGNGYFDYCNNHFMFLCQPTKYICIQNAMRFEYTWELGKRHTITAYLEWLYQYEKNAGVDRNIYSGELSESGATEAVAAQRLTNWRDNLTNKLSNFFSIGVKYTY